MKFTRRLFCVVAIFIVFAIVISPVILYLKGGRILRDYGFSCEIAAQSATHYRLTQGRLGKNNVTVTFDQIQLPKPPFLLLERLFFRPLFGGVDLGSVEILLGENFGDKSANGQAYPMCEMAIALEKFFRSPLFGLPKIIIDKVYLSGSNFSLNNIFISDGIVRFDICENVDRKLCSVSAKISTLRLFFHELSLSCRRSNAIPFDQLRRLLGNLECHFDATDFPVNLLSVFLGDYIKPQGLISGRLDVSHGSIDGFLTGQDIQLRQIRVFPMLQNIHFNFLFEGQRMLVGNASARAGDREIHLAGCLENILDEGISCDLKIFGDDIHFVRSHGVNLLGNLDLSIAASNEGGEIAGSVLLTHGYWVSDALNLAAEIRQFFASKMSTPHSLPKKWKLNLEVVGNRCLRLSTTYFRGILSGQLKVQGTCDVPIIYGQVSVADGAILFPFARFRVRSGTITLDPSQVEPDWDVDAQSRLYGYDLRLHLTGRRKVPLLNFTSSPSLSSAEIIALITSGRAPGYDTAGSALTNQWSAIGLYFGSGFLGEDFVERVRVQVGQDVTESGSGTMEVEYIFDPKRSIIGQYDRFDNYSVDFKVKIYAK